MERIKFYTTSLEDRPRERDRDGDRERDGDGEGWKDRDYNKTFVSRSPALNRSSYTKDMSFFNSPPHVTIKGNSRSQKPTHYSPKRNTDHDSSAIRESRKTTRHQNDIQHAFKNQHSKIESLEEELHYENKNLKSDNKIIKKQLQELNKKYNELQGDYNYLRSIPEKIISRTESKRELMSSNPHQERKRNLEKETLALNVKYLETRTEDLEKENLRLHDKVHNMSKKLFQLQHLNTRLDQLLKSYSCLERTVKEDQREWMEQKAAWNCEVEHYRQTIKELQHQLQFKRKRQY